MRNGPVILRESAGSSHGKINARIAKGLAELVGIRGEKIGERAEEIDAAESIGQISAKADTIHGSAEFPEMLARRARVGVNGLILIFAALGVAEVRAPKNCEAGDVDFGAG